MVVFVCRNFFNIFDIYALFEAFERQSHWVTQDIDWKYDERFRKSTPSNLRLVIVKNMFFSKSQWKTHKKCTFIIFFFHILNMRCCRNDCFEPLRFASKHLQNESKEVNFKNKSKKEFDFCGCFPLFSFFNVHLNFKNSCVTLCTKIILKNVYVIINLHALFVIIHHIIIIFQFQLKNILFTNVQTLLYRFFSKIWTFSANLFSTWDMGKL